MDLKEIPDFFCNKTQIISQTLPLRLQMAAIFYDFFLNGNGKKSRQNHKFRERKSEMKLNENF